MKNLKINKEWFKKVISTGLVLVTLSNLTGCSLNNKKASKEESKKVVSTVVSDNRMINIADLQLKDKKSGNVIEKTSIEKVLVGNKLVEDFDIIKIMFDKSVDSVLVNDELIPVESLSLYNAKYNEDIDELDYILDNDMLVPVSEYFGNSNYAEKANSTSDSKEDTIVDEELTDEEFYELVDEIYEDYSERKLDVSKEDVIDYTMLVNIDEIAEDNKYLITDIVGDRKVENVEYNAFDVYSAVATANNYNYCSKKLGWDSLILVSDTVFDQAEKKVVIELENRVKEIVEVSKDVEEFNVLLNKLLVGMLNSKEDEFNMANGVGYSTMTILINFIRINFASILDEANSELIKYFISYAEEYGTSYYDNSRSTAYYSGIYNLLTDTVNCAKTKTK